MIDLGMISLAIALGVGLLQLLNYLNTRSVRHENTADRFAKADGVALELNSIRIDISGVENKVENHSAQIALLQSACAVLVSQMTYQIRELEKLDDKLEDLK